MVGMAWEARSGLKLINDFATRYVFFVGMAWEARSGLKLGLTESRTSSSSAVGMAWEARSGLKLLICELLCNYCACRNGLGSPFGFETSLRAPSFSTVTPSEWPG